MHVQLFGELGTHLDNQEALRRWQADMAFLRAARLAAARRSGEETHLDFARPLFLALGVDLANENSIREFQHDIAFLRTVRGILEQRALWFVAAGIAGGLASALYVLIRELAFR